MSNIAARALLLIFLGSLAGFTSFAQIQYGGSPQFYSAQSIEKSATNIPTTDLTKEVTKIWDTPKSAVAENIVGIPILPPKSALKNSYLSANSGRSFIQRLELGDGAQSYVRFKNFNLPKGARLFVISENGEKVHGAYTYRNNKESQRFMVGPVKGDIVIEYDLDKPGKEDMIPFEVDQIYVNPVNFGAMETGFGSAYDCHININCVAGQSYDDEKRGVMRIVVVGDEAVFLCTGSLMNNALQNEEPYVLTAMHCQEPANTEFTPLYDMWYFDFNYEGPSCANPEEEPGFDDVQGCELVAARESTDMMLLRLTEAIPQAINVYFNGWDSRDNYLPQQTAIIHHPSGDIKKITQDFDPVKYHEEIIIWNNGSTAPALTHFISDFDDAVYQPGSSGAPLMDEAGRIIGQLHGGPLADEFCTIGIGYSGRLSESWDGDSAEERLRDWLDPENSGIEFIGGKEAELDVQVVQFEGRVVTADGIAIPNVEVALTGDVQTSFFTGTDGRFVFDGLSNQGTYELSIQKNSNHGNGISVTDIILMINHIIGRKPLSNVFQRFAADVNLDGNISIVDLVQLKNVIIGRTPEFPNTNAWRFEPEVLQMNGGNIGQLEFNVIGFKMGDLNNSANPRN